MLLDSLTILVFTFLCLCSVLLSSFICLLFVFLFFVCIVCFVKFKQPQLWKRCFKRSDENIASGTGSAPTPDTFDTEIVKGDRSLRSLSLPPALHDMPSPSSFSSVILEPVCEVDSTSPDESMGACGGLDLSLFPPESPEKEVCVSDHPTSSTHPIRRKGRASSSPPQLPSPDHFTKMRRKLTVRSPLKITTEVEQIELNQSRPPTEEEIELGYVGDHVYDDEDHKKWLAARREAKEKNPEMCKIV